MEMFEAGRSYSVMHCDEKGESVTVAERSSKSVTLADGRKVRIVVGESPDGGSEEVLRIDERGAVATGGVVRVCHLQPNA